MALTQEEARQRSLESTIGRIEESIERRQAMKRSFAAGGPPYPNHVGGAYTSNDEWQEYWKAGMTVGSLPVRPVRRVEE